VSANASRGWLLVVIGALAPACASAGGPFGIDHEVARSDTGIWSRNNQLALQYAVVATEIGGALWLGNDDELGHTFWQTMDSSLVSGIAAGIMKRTFGRARPIQGNDPNAWFKGSCCQSFPSGEVTLQASFVTPLIVRYYKQDPWIWALEVLPLYDAIARVKSQAHWQSDVIAGWALGTGLGYWTSGWKTPLTVRILPRGVSVGISKSF
jgi:undecaprenyl-diphosphatase